MKILYKLVANMTLWSQGCRELVKLFHGCDEVVARLSQGCRDFTTLPQPCHFCMGGIHVPHSKRTKISPPSQLELDAFYAKLKHNPILKRVELHAEKFSPKPSSSLLPQATMELYMPDMLHTSLFATCKKFKDIKVLV